MSFRSRLLIAITAGALLPLILALLGVRREIDRRITMMYDRRLANEARAIGDAIAHESDEIGGKLSALAKTLEVDDHFRGAARREPSERAYVLDYAERAMRLAGLNMLQIQDGDGRILSSGHFPREYDQLDAATLDLMRRAGRVNAATRARTPEGSFVALARVDSLQIAGRKFFLVGGSRIDSTFLARFERGDSVRVALHLTAVPPDSAAFFQVIGIQFADADSNHVRPVRLRITQSRAELDDLLGDANRWFAASLVVVILGAVALSVWLSHRLSRPLADLATAASRIDLEGDDVQLAAAREDEIGLLARRLSGLRNRLAASAERLRRAERRATIGDMARQVNHDIKNGLIPIRNVLRHLADVSEQHPADLPTAFAERKGTLDVSVNYLDTLARNYARLTPRVERNKVDVNGVVREAAASAAAGSDYAVVTELAPSLPAIRGDRVLLRRILDNLIRNGLESLSGTGSQVLVRTRAQGRECVRIEVRDTGRGMSPEEVAHAFDDFFTTKKDGTGLGLSVVRRLTSDLGGSVTIDSGPGRGTTFTVELPI